MDLLAQIAVADADHIHDVVLAAIKRYQELFPDWDIFYCSIDRSRNRNKQIDLQISLLERLKEQDANDQ